MSDPCIHALSGHGIFLKGLNLPWRDILYLGQLRHFAPDERMGEGDSSDDFFFIVRGKVRMLYSAEEGTQFLGAIIGENCLCGDAMVDSSSRVASFQCVGAVTACAFAKKLLLDPDFVRRYPQLFINLLQSSSTKLVHIFFSARSMAVHSPLLRVSSFLLHLLHEQGDTSQPNLTHEELATFLGMHRSTLTRTLSTLRKEGIIGAFTKKKLEVLDAERLEQLAQSLR